MLLGEAGENRNAKDWRAVFQIVKKPFTNTKIICCETILLSLGATSFALETAPFKKSFVVFAPPGRCDCISK